MQKKFEDDNALPFASVPAKDVVADSLAPLSNYTEKSFTTERALISASCAQQAFEKGDIEFAATKYIQASRDFLEASMVPHDYEVRKSLLFLSEVHAQQASYLNDGNKYIKNPNMNDTSKTDPHLLLFDPQRYFLKSSTNDQETSLFSNSKLNIPEVNEVETCIQSMLQLESQLSKIGFGSKVIQNHTPKPTNRHLSSALGDSFCLLNRSVIPIRSLEKSADSARVLSDKSLYRNSILYPCSYGKKMIHTDEINFGSASHMNCEGSFEQDDIEQPHFLQKDTINLSITNNSETNQTEIIRLLNCLKVLGEENAHLMKKCEEMQRHSEASLANSDEIKKFKELYSVRFRKLKKALSEFQQNYPLSRGIEREKHNTSNMIEKFELESQVEALSLKVKQLNSILIHKDEMLERYDMWYQTVKQNASLRQKKIQASRVNDGSGIS